jgi:glycosyltransferase involved in cell wall biosynthesis
MSTSFAVVITSYNYRDFIAEAIDSALQQTRPAQQIIVVDDGSTDGSQDYLRERYGRDPRVTLLCGENGGQLVAFQRGVAASDADVLCFLDADDRWSPAYLAKIGAIYDSRKDVGFVFSDIVLFGNEQRRIGYADKPVDLGYTAISTWALTHWYGAPTSALSMRTLYAQRALELPDQLYRTWKLCADNCLVFGASLFGARKYFLPTGDVGYRVHGNNGWWSNRNQTTDFLNLLHSRGLIAHYARIAGIDDSCLALAKLEYKTKPAPDWAETKRYMALCMRSRASLWKRLERAISIFARGKRVG